MFIQEGSVLSTLVLIFFVVLPIIRGLLGGSGKKPSEESVDWQEILRRALDENPTPEANTPRPTTTPSPLPTTSTRPLPSPTYQSEQNQNRPPEPMVRKISPQEVLEAQKAKAREKMLRQSSISATTKVAPKTTSSSPAQVTVSQHSAPIATDRASVQNGVLWNMILSEPRGAYWAKNRHDK